LADRSRAFRPSRPKALIGPVQATRYAGGLDYVSKLKNGYDIAVVSRRAIQCVLPHHKGIAGKSKHDNDWLYELRR